MSLVKRRLMILALGILAGTAAWPFMEFLLGVQEHFPGYLLFSLVSGAALGLTYGTFFGTADGIIAGRWFRIAQGAGAGAVLGLVGGALGFLSAQGLFMVLGELIFTGSSQIRGWALTLSRALGWSILGLFVGAVEGVRARSLRKSGIGMLGGFTGGLFGGVVLEALGILLPGAALGTLVGLTVFGGCIGLSYGLVERSLSYGALRVLNGPFKGKEFILNQRLIRIGSDARCDVLLEGYRDVEAVHALIHLRRGELYLEPAEAGGTVVVNDDLTDQRLLKFDDVLKIGRAKLFFKQVLVILAVILPLGIGIPLNLHAQEVTIGQVDTSRLLTRQEVGLFLSIRDDQGFPVNRLSTQDLRVYESGDGENFIPVPLTGFNTYSSGEQGIDFYLLVDNSGSMYETIDGETTQDPAAMRMAQVRSALIRFLDNLALPRDRAGIYTFNTYIDTLTPPTDDPGLLRRALGEIQRPARADGYTELYAAISRLSGALESGPRRKVIIVLSDGENLPYRYGEGQPHPLFGDRIFTMDDGVQELQRAGVSLFAVGYGPVWEQSLVPLTAQAGGEVYNASDSAELAGVYRDIREQVLREYSLSYRAAMIPSPRRTIRVEYLPGSGAPGGAETGSGSAAADGAAGQGTGSGAVARNADAARAQREYFSGTLLGIPGGLSPWVGLGAVLVSLAVWLVLTRLRFLNRWKSPNLEILGKGSTRMFALGPEETIIGSSDADDVTLVGSPNTKPHHATVVYDPGKHQYTVVSEDGIRVNNKKTSRRPLESGDVIDLGGTLVVFDEPEHPGPEGDDASKQTPRKPAT